MPGIDDGGLGLVLTAPRATIKADGAPHRVPVGGFTAPAQLSLVTIPLRSPWVHLRARLANPGPQPLLAGPVDLIMASGYVGRAEIGFVAAGEKFHLGFGPEADVRVHREERTEREEAGLLGGRNSQQVRVSVRLSNLGTERREIVVTERIPISEVEQVEVARLGARRLPARHRRQPRRRGDHAGHRARDRRAGPGDVDRRAAAARPARGRARVPGADAARRLRDLGARREPCRGVREVRDARQPRAAERAAPRQVGAPRARDLLARVRPRHPGAADHRRHLRGRARHQRLPPRRARGARRRRRVA